MQKPVLHVTYCAIKEINKTIIRGYKRNRQIIVAARKDTRDEWKIFAIAVAFNFHKVLTLSLLNPTYLIIWWQ